MNFVSITLVLFSIFNSMWFVSIRVFFLSNANTNVYNVIHFEIEDQPFKKTKHDNFELSNTNNIPPSFVFSSYQFINSIAMLLYVIKNYVFAAYLWQQN